MGCDIHVHCEYRKDGIWYNCDNFEWDQETKQYTFQSIYWGRNYDLFGILAGIRSRDFEMIDAPRGLPNDMSLKTKEMAEADMDWTHSHSWLTLKELLKWKEKQERKWKKLKKKYEVEHDNYEGDFIVDCNGEVTFKYEKKMLNYLIRRMKDKMDNHIFCFEEEDYYLSGDDFRIIFWFDN